MRWTKSLIPTLRQAPAEAVVPSHQLMLRAGVIQQVASGAYNYLPLGWRSLHKAMEIIRTEMNSAGAAEVFMPALQPIEWWEATGRRARLGENMFVVTDRHGREQAPGPTHEEVITMLFGGAVTSYKQLPVNLYQIQTKFRDEYRPRFGVLRSREFQMKDAYSFHLTVDGPDGLDVEYQNMYDCYCRIFDRCGLKYVIVEAETGDMGGNASHQFTVLTPTGEDTIFTNDSRSYSANIEKCSTGARSYNLDGEPTGELDKVHTPDCSSIEDVSKFMKVKPKNMLKSMVYKAGDELIVAVVRGDHDVNEEKLKDATGQTVVGLADDAEAKAAGFPVGFIGPHVEVSCRTFIDFDAAQDQFWAAGGNEVDHHVKHFNWKRDLIQHVDDTCYVVADIRNAIDGDPAPEDRGGGTLHASKGIEVGQVFKLGRKYTQALGVTVLDENQQNVVPIMGCYGIGVNRILASAIEQEGGHDDRGIIWPMALAPFHVVITPIKYSGDVAKVCDDIYATLTAADIDVLLDDRDERPGVKFNDADLIGIPLRIVIGDKGLANQEVELKARTADKPEMVKADAICDHVINTVRNELS